MARKTWSYFHSNPLKDYFTLEGIKKKVKSLIPMAVWKILAQNKLTQMLWIIAKFFAYVTSSSCVYIWHYIWISELFEIMKLFSSVILVLIVRLDVVHSYTTSRTENFLNENFENRTAWKMIIWTGFERESNIHGKKEL